jgi:hypothetical protein
MKKPRKESGEVTLSAIEGVVTRAIKKQVPRIVDERINEQVPKILGDFMRDDMIPAIDNKFSSFEKRMDRGFEKLELGQKEILYQLSEGQEKQKVSDEKAEDHEERIDLLEKEVYPTAGI